MRSSGQVPDAVRAAVFRALPAGYVVLGPEQIVLDATDEFLRLVGRHRADLVGRPQSEVFPPGPGSLPELCERVLAHRLPDAVPLVRHDLPHDLRHEDAPEPAERWWSLTATPVLDADGRVQAVVGGAQDVTASVLEHRRTGLTGHHAALDTSLRTALDTSLRSRVQDSREVSALADVGLRLSAARTLDDVVRVVSQGLTTLGADGSGIAVPAEDGGWRLVGSNAFDDDYRARWEHVPHDSPLPVCHSARTGERLLLPDAATADAYHPVMPAVREQSGRNAWALFPLVVGGGVLGALAVAWTQDHTCSADELELLEGFAAQCAQAVERIGSERVAEDEVRAVRRMAETLQRSLLTQPPLREGLQLATRYQPAARGAQVGGDWFDAFPTRSGGTVLVVGDVSGHDQTAAAAMSQVRNLVRGISYDGDDRPANLLARLDQAMAGLGLETLTTAVLAVLDAPVNGVAGRRLRWANAGHLPPLLRHPDGRVERLGPSGDLLLGLDPTTVRREHTVTLVPGDVLVLYTDGLVERRDGDLDDGIATVADALAAPDGVTAGAWADFLLGTLGPAGTADDTALLVVRIETDTSPDTLRSPAGDPQEIVLPADPRSVRDARRLARRCCHRSGLPDSVAETAELLTSELVTNAIVHGRSDTRVRITATPDLVHVEVSDDNDRRPLLQAPDDDALSGRGLSMLETSASRWGVDDADIGKVVWFTLDAV
ncbi:SpoIIE family protein phosphatase [Kineococcus sp. R86509]|uniref:SpoIIE family protein phosphatase n=1 Tax=Kineococcus sp. R86509 TaxID=3093851 RepID=UPI0036D31373